MSLAVLLQHPGEVVTREELRSQNWPADTFVDFDNSLNHGDQPSCREARWAIPQTAHDLSRRCHGEGNRFNRPGHRGEMDPTRGDPPRV